MCGNPRYYRLIPSVLCNSDKSAFRPPRRGPITELRTACRSETSPDEAHSEGVIDFSSDLTFSRPLALSGPNRFFFLV